MEMNRLLAAIGIWAFLAFPAAAHWPADDVEDYVAFLGSPEGKKELGLEGIHRPGNIVNRLDVVFRGEVPMAQRHENLRKIGREFLMRLFKRRGIFTASIIERDSSGSVRNRAVVNFGGTPRMPSDRPSRPACI